MANSQQYSLTIMDFSDEVSTFEATTELVTAASLPPLLGLTGSFEVALAPMIMGTIIRKQQDVYDNKFPKVRPASAVAQRESKWLVVYHDNVTGKIFRCSIPTANKEGHMTPGTDLAAIGDGGVVDAFKLAFENAFRSPDDSTHGITIEKIVGVGRNL